jgi:4-hydroxy-3-methylbut-2-en-1-yl diphosphate reductase
VPDNAMVIFSAHGVPRQVAAEARQRGLSAIDATCPLVSKVHNEVKHHVAAGRVVLLIGHPDHPEVIGTAGQVPEGKVRVVSDREAALTLPLDPAQAYGLATQTTLSVSDAAAVENALRERLLHLHGPARDDICYATTNRQRAVRDLAPHCEAFIIMGGYASSNSRRLVETAEAAGCARVQLIERPDELRFSSLDGVRVLGVSSGASTPEASMGALIARLGELFDVDLVQAGAAEETVRFGLPIFPPRATASPRAAPRGNAVPLS